ncbi:ABC transporter substrate-binding protein [Rhodococcus sp. CH91]|uniref:ABC transporter substrate-binding protein n=1 Tax=Rhodococcus sp. CH91 TaxID=2910256 RepID=UPI001F4AF52D|nr:ABC transporter substrate-binding protein [Rhodococcus sp. CH91]
MFSRPSLRRRRPLWGAVALSLVGSLAVAGCSSAVGQADAGATEGGVLRIGEALDLVPASIYAGAPVQAAVTGLVYDTLIDYPADGLDAEPHLATAWEIAPDGLSARITLRDDVTFHDGRPMTSEDVEFSIRTYADPQRAGQLARTAALITGYDTSDPHALVLTLAQPAANLLDLLDIVPIIDRHSIADFETGTSYNGTGAFRFTEWKPGTSITFDANDEYWDGAPNLDGVEIVIVPDAQTRISQLRSGQLDLLLTVSPRDADQLGADPNFRIVDQAGVERTWYLGADVGSSGLSDVRVRQAIAYAVDRNRILDDVYRGHGDVGNLPWPEYSPAYDAELNSTYTLDQDRARALVAEVGEIPVIPLSYATGSIEAESTAQIIQADLAAVGIDTTLVPLDGATSLKNLIGGTFGGLWVYGHTYAQYTPATLPTSAFPFNAYKNTSNFVDPDYQRAVDTAWRIPDPRSAEAEDAYRALNAELLDNVFVIGLHNATGLLATTSDLHDFGWSKKAELDLSDAYLGG